MKKLSLLIAIGFFTTTMLKANNFKSAEPSDLIVYVAVGKEKIKLTCSQPDAEIYVDDRARGKGSVEIEVPDKGCTWVQVQKEGYITEKIEFCNKKDMQKLPNSYHFNLKKDDAYDATIKSDVVNIDQKIVAKYEKDKAWQILNQIVLDNFDAVEMSDKETGYLRTAWVVTRYKYSAVRTRFIVKQSSSDPLIFKVKLVSEHAQNGMAGANDDEHFKEWDRIVRKYSSINAEIEARVR